MDGMVMAFRVAAVRTESPAVSAIEVTVVTGIRFVALSCGVDLEIRLRRAGHRRQGPPGRSTFFAMIGPAAAGIPGEAAAFGAVRTGLCCCAQATSYAGSSKPYPRTATSRRCEGSAPRTFRAAPGAWKSPKKRPLRLVHLLHHQRAPRRPAGR